MAARTTPKFSLDGALVIVNWSSLKRAAPLFRRPGLRNERCQPHPGSRWNGRGDGLGVPVQPRSGEVLSALGNAQGKWAMPLNLVPIPRRPNGPMVRQQGEPLARWAGRFAHFAILPAGLSDGSAAPRRGAASVQRHRGKEGALRRHREERRCHPSSLWPRRAVAHFIPGNAPFHAGHLPFPYLLFLSARKGRGGKEDSERGRIPSYTRQRPAGPAGKEKNMRERKMLHERHTLTRHRTLNSQSIRLSSTMSTAV